MKWRIGYVALDSVTETMPTDQVIRGLAELGFDAVDWTIEQFDPLEQDRQDFTELVTRSRAAGLDVLQLQMHQDLISGDRHQRARQALRVRRGVEAAAAAGVPTVGVLTGPNVWEQGAVRIGADMSEEDAWACATDSLDGIIEVAKREGVDIGLEPVWGSIVDSAARLQRMLDALPDLGVNYDPSHLVLPGDDIPHFTRLWAKRIVHVHLKDAFGRRGKAGSDFIFPLLGEGAVPWAEVFAILDDADYGGCMSIEFESWALLRQCFAGDIARPIGLSLDLARRLMANAAAGRLDSRD